MQLELGYGKKCTCELESRAVEIDCPVVKWIETVSWRASRDAGGFQLCAVACVNM